MELSEFDFYCPNKNLGEKHSQELDLSLGFRIDEIEAAFLAKARELNPEGSLHTWGETLHGAQTWVGLATEVLQTPYNELLAAIDWIKPQGHLVDLGAGYGRLGFLLARYYPQVKFTGFEYVPERVLEGNRVFHRWRLTQASLIHQDLIADNFFPPLADTYFIYDYGKVSHIRHTLNQLGQLADQKTFLLVTRGEGVRSLVFHEFPWLSPLYHNEKISIFGF